jgi:hypothetical protein
VCRKRRISELPLDERSSCTPLFAIQSVQRVSQLNIAGVLQRGVVRSFTLTTRARPGFGPVFHHYGDAYIGWPSAFFKRHVRVLATDVSQARFRPVIAPIAARLIHDTKTTGCAAG